MKNSIERSKKTYSNNLKVLGVLTAAYFIVEIIINHAVFRQMSYSGSFFSITSMEFWGKIVTGLGLALIISRLCATNRFLNNLIWKKTNYKTAPCFFGTLKVFILACIVTIPLSFFLQNKLIDYIVDSSTSEDRNKAMLVMAAHSTVSPFFKPIIHDNSKAKELLEETKVAKNNEDNKPKYNPTAEQEGFDLVDIIKPEKATEIGSWRKALYPFVYNRYAIHSSYVREQDFFSRASLACSHIGQEAFGDMSPLDKVFFPYFSFKNKIDERRYVEAIKQNAICLIDDKTYRLYLLNNVFSFKSALAKMHKELYIASANEYITYARIDKQRADKEWRKRMNEFYGFPTTIDPSGEWPTYFFNHPDTVRYYEKMTGFKNLHPTGDHFEERVKRYMLYHADEFILPGYTPTQMDTINTPVDADMTPLVGPRLEVSAEMKDEMGKSAYKSVILPIVVLGLSAVFLIINTLLFLHGWASKKMSKKVTTPMLATAFLVVVLSPLALPSDLGNKEKEYFSSDSPVSYNYVVKWVYFHERNIAAAYFLVSPAMEVVSKMYDKGNTPHGTFF